MKKILILMVCIYSLSFSKVIVGDTIKQFNIKDQFDKPHIIKKSTKLLVFAFKKASGHEMKDYLKKQGADYLSSKDMLFIADVSAMPSFIKFFVLPITGYDFPILTLDDEAVSSEYKVEEMVEKVMVVTLDNLKVTNIRFIDKASEL